MREPRVWVHWAGEPVCLPVSLVHYLTSDCNHLGQELVTMSEAEQELTRRRLISRTVPELLEEVKALEPFTHHNHQARQSLRLAVAHLAIVERLGGAPALPTTWRLLGPGDEA